MQSRMVALAAMAMLGILASFKAQEPQSGGERGRVIWQGFAQLTIPSTRPASMNVVFQCLSRGADTEFVITRSGARSTEMGTEELLRYRFEPGQEFFVSASVEFMGKLGDVIMIRLDRGADTQAAMCYCARSNGKLDRVFYGGGRFGVKVVSVQGQREPCIVVCDGDLSGEKKSIVYEWSGDRFVAGKVVGVVHPHLYAIVQK